jgi:hypothetical protein
MSYYVVVWGGVAHYVIVCTDMYYAYHCVIVCDGMWWYVWECPYISHYVVTYHHI